MKKLRQKSSSTLMPCALVWGMNDHQESCWVLNVVTRTHCPLAATLRQLLGQAPRRKAAVHDRWCSLRTTLGWNRPE